MRRRAIYRVRLLAIEIRLPSIGSMNLRIRRQHWLFVGLSLWAVISGKNDSERGIFLEIFQSVVVLIDTREIRVVYSQ